MLRADLSAAASLREMRSMRRSWQVHEEERKARGPGFLLLYFSSTNLRFCSAFIRLIWASCSVKPVRHVQNRTASAILGRGAVSNPARDGDWDASSPSCNRGEVYMLNYKQVCILSVSLCVCVCV